MEIHQKLGPDYHRLKAMVKRSIEQEIRNKNFVSRNGNFEKNAVVKNQGTKQRVRRILGDCWQWEFNGQCIEGDNCSFRHDINKRGKMTQSNTSPNSFMQQNERKASRTRSPRGKSPVVECLDGLARITSKELATTHFVKGGTLQNACSTSPRVFCRFGEKCSYAQRGPSNRRFSDARQLGCVFQDMTPPKSIVRKSTDMPKPIQRVKFTKAVARHTEIRDKNPSLGYLPR